MTTRPCGDCSECCFSLHIQETEKPPREWCKHACVATGGRGCAIYEARPKVCHDYQCAWKDPGPLADILDEDARPDRSGIIFQVVAVGQERAIEAIVRDVPTPAAEALIAKVIERTGVVSLSTTGGHEIRSSASGFARVMRLHAAARREAELAAHRDRAQEAG